VPLDAEDIVIVLSGSRQSLAQGCPFKEPALSLREAFREDPKTVAAVERNWL
jgi:hypothetical protein